MLESGDRCFVRTADYQSLAVVRCAFRTKSGLERYVIEITAGLLLIQSRKNLHMAGLARRAEPPESRWRFEIGQQVRKAGGEYHPAGEVLARFFALGAPRYVVEHAEGILHLYRESALAELVDTA